jgi:poly(A) polymerase
MEVITRHADRLKRAFAHDRALVAVIMALGADQARIVGGAVRDALLGRVVSDIDIATSLDPHMVMEKLGAAGLKTVPTGLAHGTITAISGHRPFEVTSLRHDVESFGRHARVRFTDDWAADAARRDFTMNALYADLDGRLYDEVGGLEDAQKGRVVFIGDPVQRIAEDALRILRFFRFHAHYGRGEPDRKSLQAAIELADRLDILSVERIRAESLKLLAAADPCPVMMLMDRGGILAHILPEKRPDPEFGVLRRLIARETSLGIGDPLRRLAAVIRVGARAQVGARLKCSGAEQKRLAAMDGPVPAFDPPALGRAAYALGVPTVLDRLLLGDQDMSLSALAAIRDQLDAIAARPAPRFPVSGADLAALGVPAGPQMGEILGLLQKHWVASDFSLSKNALPALAEKQAGLKSEQPKPGKKAGDSFDA